MSFASALRAYCKALNCTNKVIAARCGVSTSTLSRYLNGERTPDVHSRALRNLAEGISALSRETRPAEPLRADDVLAAFEAELAGSSMVGMDFNARLDALMHLVDIRNIDFAEVAGVDASYVSRIRKGQRTPANMAAFVGPCAHLAADMAIARGLLAEVAGLIGMPEVAHDYYDWGDNDAFNLSDAIEMWLTGDQIVQADVMRLDSLLSWLDEQDFSPWLSLSDADEPDPRPAAPYTSRFYYGLGGMREAELAFMETALASKPRTMSLSSDMPMLRIWTNDSFLERYRNGLARILKTGCRIDMTFNLERPLEDTIQSLHLWIPLFMTGKVTPHHLKGVNNRLFYHVNYVCDACALASETVADHQEDGRFYFTTRPDDVLFYQRKLEFIREKSTPMIEVYRDCDPAQHDRFALLSDGLRTSRDGHVIGDDRFHTIRATHYPDRCSVISIPCGSSAVHLVIRHPKINYILARMK